MDNKSICNKIYDLCYKGSTKEKKGVIKRCFKGFLKENQQFFIIINLFLTNIVRVYSPQLNRAIACWNTSKSIELVMNNVITSS